jgi:ribonuclease P protein component
VASALANRRPEDPSRLGLAVRCSGAVARNRVKRRLRAAFLQVGPVGGYDVVVRADGRALDIEYSNLVKDLGIALGRVTGGEK